MCAAFFQAVDEVLDGVDVPTNMGCGGADGYWRQYMGK